MASNWQTYKDDLLLFVEAGYIAVNQADEDSAMKLFRVAEMLDPENILPTVGFGYLHLHKLELKQSIQQFEKALEKDAGNEMAKTFLGIAFSMTPNQVEKGEKLLEETVHSKDPLIKRLSDTAIDFVERFVKKSPGPAAKAK